MLRKIYKEENGNLIRGEWIPAFSYNQRYLFTEVEVYEDGSIVTNLGNTDLAGLKGMISGGEIITKIPDGDSFTILHSYTIKVSDFKGIDEYDFIKEIEDILSRLQGKEDRREFFWRKLFEYIKNPTDQFQVEARRAYEDIPAHVRIFCSLIIEGEEAIDRLLYTEPYETDYVEKVNEYLSKTR